MLDWTDDRYGGEKNRGKCDIENFIFYHANQSKTQKSHFTRARCRKLHVRPGGQHARSGMPAFDGPHPPLH